MARAQLWGAYRLLQRRACYEVKIDKALLDCDIVMVINMKDSVVSIRNLVLSF